LEGNSTDLHIVGGSKTPLLLFIEQAYFPFFIQPYLINILPNRATLIYYFLNKSIGRSLVIIDYNIWWLF
jgi:hypothetical protein